MLPYPGGGGGNPWPDTFPNGSDRFLTPCKAWLERVPNIEFNMPLLANLFANSDAPCQGLLIFVLGDIRELFMLLKLLFAIFCLESSSFDVLYSAGFTV